MRKKQAGNRDYKPEPDIEVPGLMESFHKGEDSAFRYVFNKLAKSLLYYAESIIENFADAEDIVANCFAKLYEKRANRESWNHIKRWMYVIVRNECIDYLRHRDRNREMISEISRLSNEADAIIYMETLKSLLLDTMAAEIEKLPRQRREAVRQYFFAGKPTREIAVNMGVKGQTSLNHKSRALSSLREAIRNSMAAGQINLMNIYH